MSASSISFSIDASSLTTNYSLNWSFYPCLRVTIYSNYIHLQHFLLAFNESLKQSWDSQLHFAHIYCQQLLRIPLYSSRCYSSSWVQKASVHHNLYYSGCHSVVSKKSFFSTFFRLFTVTCQNPVCPLSRQQLPEFQL